MQIIDAQIHTWGTGLPSNQSHWQVTHFTPADAIALLDDGGVHAAVATWADVRNTNTYVTDFDEFQKCGDVRMRYFGVATPTSTTVGVTRLAGPDFMIEIEAVAVVNT